MESRKIYSKRIALFDELMIKSSDAYIRLENWDVLIYTRFLDFDAIKIAMNHYKTGKMKFEINNNGLPILLDIGNINRSIYDILYDQLLTETTPKFNSINEQIDYILLVERLTCSNANDISNLIKDIKFDPEIYAILPQYGFNASNYINKFVTINQLIESFLFKYYLLIVDKYTKQVSTPMCKYDLKCKSRHDSNYNCKWRHSPVKLSKEIENLLTYDLSRYNILFLGKKEIIWDGCKYNSHNYDCKLLSEDNIIYDIIHENGFSFAYNPQKFINRDKYEYKDRDEYGKEIYIFSPDGKLNIFRHVALFKPYRCCGNTIMYHVHGN